MKCERDLVVEVAVALGANQGDVRHHFQQAQWGLQNLACSPVEMSGVYRSAPWQALGPDYWNAVAVFQTCLSAPDLLDGLMQLECQAGRERPFHHAPRTLDLDLIVYGQAMIWSQRLQVPHPRWVERAFVREPWAELRPAVVAKYTVDQVKDPSLKRVADWSDWLLGVAD